MGRADVGGYLTYDRAICKLSGKQEKKIGHSTWVCRRDKGDVAVKYHYTDIITFHPDYSITVRTGGWDTATTRSRLNDLLQDHAVYGEGGGIIEDIEGTTYWLNPTMEIDSKGYISGEIPIFASMLGSYLKRDLQTMEAAKQAVREQTIEQMEKVWKKFKGDRGFLARNCIETFLPLAMASSINGDEHWMSIVRKRLSSKETT
jgi:hypothetical protein